LEGERMIIAYIILLGFLFFIGFFWLLPVARAKDFSEVYEACGMGCLGSLLILNLAGIWDAQSIFILRVIGFSLYAVAFFFAAFAFINLRRKGKPEDAWERTTRLITSGVYGVIRHPMYFGSAVWAIGIILVFFSIRSLILGAVSIVFFVLASRLEDEKNIKKFGDAYREYIDRVPRWNILKWIGGGK
jgi:protein-S-isoprenylcysteine O-methyltransferase Ste14